MDDEKITQDEVFLHGEGDAYFERNKYKMALGPDIPFEIIKEVVPEVHAAYEIGCADGFRLDRLHETYKCYTEGVDASTAAVNAAYKAGRNVRYGSAIDTPMRSKYDLIIVNFVFHWIDRANYLKLMAHIDSLLVDGGHLFIGDFAECKFTKRRYHHLPDRNVWTYKMMNDMVFLSTGLYKTVTHRSSDEYAYTVLKKESKFVEG